MALRRRPESRAVPEPTMRLGSQPERRQISVQMTSQGLEMETQTPSKPASATRAMKVRAISEVMKS